MKIRLILTSIVLFSLSFGIYYIAQWLASDGLNIDSRQLIPAFAALLATGLIWIIWNFEIRHSEPRKKALFQERDNVEKKKRERLDSVIRDLSDEDLLRLRRRLLDGTIDDNHLESALLGEDGELLNERR